MKVDDEINSPEKASIKWKKINVTMSEMQMVTMAKRNMMTTKWSVAMMTKSR